MCTNIFEHCSIISTRYTRYIFIRSPLKYFLCKFPSGRCWTIRLYEKTNYTTEVQIQAHTSHGVDEKIIKTNYTTEVQIQADISWYWWKKIINIYYLKLGIIIPCERKVPSKNHCCKCSCARGMVRACLSKLAISLNKRPPDNLFKLKREIWIFHNYPW